MSAGYQIVEPLRLNALMVNPGQVEFCVAVLQWLAREVRVELGGLMDGVEISVICVEYLGAYPALGVAYGEGAGDKDIGALIEETADRLLRERSVAEFADFIGQGLVDWRELSGTIMSK